MTLVSRIKEVAQKKGISISELERNLGLARSSIRKWDTNTPSLDKVIAASNFLQVSLNYLATGEDQEFKNDFLKKYNNLTTEDKLKIDGFIEVVSATKDTIKEEIVTKEKDYEEDNYEEIIREKDPYRVKRKNQKYNYKYYKPVAEPNKIENIPFVGTVAAGIPNLSYYEGYYEYIGSPVDCDFAFRANGDSMYPVINDNDYIYVRATPILENGEIGIISINGETTCKKFYVEDQKIILKSFNPDYDPMERTFKDDIKVLGKVILTPEQEKRL